MLNNYTSPALAKQNKILHKGDKIKGNYLSKESDILTEISHQSPEKEDNSNFTFFSLKLHGGRL